MYATCAYDIMLVRYINTLFNYLMKCRLSIGRPIHSSFHPWIFLSHSLSLCITEIPSIFSPLVMGKPWKSPLIDVFPIKSSIVHGQPWLPEGSELGQWRCMYWPGKAQNNEQWTILAEDSRKNKYLINLINLINLIWQSVTRHRYIFLHSTTT